MAVYRRSAAVVLTILSAAFDPQPVVGGRRAAEEGDERAASQARVITLYQKRLWLAVGGASWVSSQP